MRETRRRRESQPTTMQPAVSLELGTIIWACSAHVVRGSDAGGGSGVPRSAAPSVGEGGNWKVNKDVKTSPLMLLPFPFSLLTLDPTFPLVHHFPRF